MSGVASASVDLSIVIPAYNEEATVGQVVAEHDRIAREISTGFEILVLDDGSTDGTRHRLTDLARAIPSVRILEHQSNEGIGISLLDLYASAVGHWIFFNAADGQIPASELAIMWSARHGNALIVGRRTPRRDPLMRRLMAHAYSAALRVAFGLRVADVHSVKLYDARELRSAWPTSSSSFAEDEILIALHRRHRPILEIPVRHQPRVAGVAHGGSPRIIVRALWDFVAFVVAHRFRR